VERGLLDRAEKPSLEALELARETGSTRDEANSLAMLAERHVADGNPTAALREVDDAFAIAPKDDDTGLSWLYWERALVLADTDDLAGSKAAIDKAIALARKHKALGDVVNMLDVLALNRLYAKDLSGARAALDEAAPIERKLGHQTALARDGVVR